MVKKWLLTSGALLLSVAMVVMVFPWLQNLTAPRTKKPDPTQQNNAMLNDRYDGAGLENGRTLATEPLAEFEGTVIYSDRLVKRFTYDEADLFHIADGLKALKKTGEGLERVFLMPVPPRALMEETGFEKDAEQYGQYIQRLRSFLDGVATVIDPWPALSEHTDEYIFYRTEDAWSARGAYYGAAALLEALGAEPIPLERYEEHQYANFKGNIRVNIEHKYDEVYGEENNVSRALDNMENDPCYYYLYPKAWNLELYTSSDDKEFYQPIIALSRTGKSTFVGGRYRRAVLKGDSADPSKADQTLLVICDSSGQMAAPYLANCYQNVYVVHISWNNTFKEELPRIISEYGIRDAVVIQSADEVGEAGQSRALNELLQ